MIYSLPLQKQNTRNVSHIVIPLLDLQWSMIYFNHLPDHLERERTKMFKKELTMDCRGDPFYRGRFSATNLFDETDFL